MFINYFTFFILGVAFCGLFIYSCLTIYDLQEKNKRYSEVYLIKKMNKALKINATSKNYVVYLYCIKNNTMYSLFAYNVSFDFKLHCFKLDNEIFKCKDYLKKWYFVKI